MMRKNTAYCLLALLLIVFACQAVYQAASNSTVSDEVAHLAAGYSYLKFHDYRLNLEHPPLAKQLGALPLLFMDLKFAHESPDWESAEQWGLGRSFLYALGNPAEKMLLISRAMIIFLGLLFALFLFFTVSRFWGMTAGLAAVFFYTFSPEILVHCSLVNTDFAGAVFFTAFFCTLYRAFENGSVKTLAAAGILGGFALISKFSMMQILPLFYFFSFVLAFWGHPGLPAFRFRWWMLVIAAAFTFLHKISAMIFAAPIVFSLGLLFAPRLKIYHNAKINKAVSILLFLLVLAFLVTALAYLEPAFWIDKFRPFKRFLRGWMIFKDHAKNLQHPGFLFGEMKYEGWRHYYLVALLVKIPAPILIFGLWGFLSLLKNKLWRWQWLFFALPCAMFFFIASYINKVNIGVRHVLPIYPFFLIFAAYGFKSLWHSSKPAVTRCLVLTLSFWLIFSVSAAFPNYLSYFNEFSIPLGGKEKILGDSNISWGQDLRRLQDYISRKKIEKIKTLLIFNFAEELDYYKLPWVEGDQDFANQAPGIYAVDVFVYQKLILLRDYAWLKDRKPDDRVGGSILIYRL